MLKVQEIREIIKLIDQSTIDEFSYETNGAKLKLKKTGEPKGAQPVVEQIEQITETRSTQVEQQLPALAEKQNDEQLATEVATNVDFDQEIFSPMVGTFYRASSPDSDPFVTEGSRVAPDTVVCIVEAMKLFNEIESETSGEIVEILVEDGELVEYGQPLFRVKK